MQIYGKPRTRLSVYVKEDGGTDITPRYASFSTLSSPPTLQPPTFTAIEDIFDKRLLMFQQEALKECQHCPDTHTHTHGSVISQGGSGVWLSCNQRICLLQWALQNVPWVRMDSNSVHALVWLLLWMCLWNVQQSQDPCPIHSLKIKSPWRAADLSRLQLDGWCVSYDGRVTPVGAGTDHHTPVTLIIRLLCLFYILLFYRTV